MATEDDLVRTFLDMYVGSRGSGIRTLRAFLDGWRPKSPDTIEMAIADLIEGLSEEQRRDLVRALTYFIDLSFFNLLTRFEQGEGPWMFKLRLINRDTGDEIDLVDPTVIDRDLRSEFLGRVDPDEEGG